jgi:polysaccharide chain length determinant protein (PEP-CTERM system associated)
MREPAEKSLNEMLGPLWLAVKRYWKVAIWPALAALGVGLLLAARIPSYYSSDTLIFMQPQKLSSKLIEEQKREEVNERLQALVQEILSRPRLRALVDRFKLYPEYKGVSGAEKALQKLKSSIDVSPAQSATGEKLLQTFKLTFTHRDPNMVYEVTKALANLFIEESVFDRQSEVRGTQEFFDAQLAEARKRLEETENKVQEFVRENFGRLPEHLEQAVARLQTLQSQLESNSQILSANLARKGILETELSEVRKLASAAGGDDPRSLTSDPQEAVQQLESALAVLRSKYTDQHPDVVATVKRIEVLRQQLSKSGGKKTGAIPRTNTQGAAAVLNVRRQLGEVEIAINTLKSENEKLKSQIAKLNADIQEMPLKEQELLKIKRDYANLQETYQKLMGERDSAGLQASMIRSQKATQLRVVEPPERPTQPAGPPRLLIAAGGVIFAIMLFGAIPVALYFFSGSFRSKEEVEETLGVKVIGVIPPMITPEALASVRRIQWVSGAASAISFLALSAVIVLFVR